jgi:Integrase core domain
MGSIGDCYDNAMIESFWGRVQTELLNRQRWRTRIELATALFEYLEIFHNRRRRHSSCLHPSNTNCGPPRPGPKHDHHPASRLRETQAHQVYLASRAADVLCGRYIFASEDVRQMVARAGEIEEQDLYVLRERE